ncbi:OmpA family protein [Riemerella columbipharyngis]|uniref:Thrombospondin type 3 repeat-containing protein n=2 Tax=Riemerella columbipharyngis TaxID=1071918 RepID=A0A1G7DI15_9FLAO|nr:OmpA family protein [Riemerella columbipharyngis]SDE51109.1 Thrombospondin type 3 repeat-containing protein [Riemerella columbipharyngis]
MKNLKLGISALVLGLASTAFAQTTTNPWLIGVGTHGVNHVAVGSNFGAGEVVKTAFTGKDLYNINNYEITPPLSKLTVARNLGRALVVDWQTTVGNLGNKKLGMEKEFFLMTGLGLQLKVAGLFNNEDFWFDPYVRVGANYLRHDYSGMNIVNGDGKMIGKDHFALATGLGTNIWLTKNFGVGIQGDYVSTPTDKSNAANFWQASATLNFRFGNTDRDKDGVLDKDDLCPETPGLAEFQGCPDTDGDGVPDKDDQCIDVAGPKENNGCPWPDTDGDGVFDKDDQCPNEAGPVENNGCPWPDRDNDGVLDKDDQCPDVPGLVENNGCPKTQEQYATEATGKLQNILFNFNKATLRPESDAKIADAAEVIKSSNGGTFLVIGHTDAKGNSNYNLKLSRERAASVVKALEAHGVSSDQLKSKGVGSANATVPATASNEERMADRKVVVEAVNGAAWDALQKSDLSVVVKKVVKVSHSKKSYKRAKRRK